MTTPSCSHRYRSVAYTREGVRTLAVVNKGADAYNGVYNLFNMGACGLGLFEIRYNAWREATSDETCKCYCSEMPTEPAADPAGGKSYYSPRR